MSGVITYEVHLQEDEFGILKSLAERWFNELNGDRVVIEETFPESMRKSFLDELAPAIDKAKRICAELGVALNDN